MSDFPSWQRDIALLFLAIGLFFCIGLGARPYLCPSEARYIEIPRQMLITGDWLTPRLDGVPYFEKPPLFYWMQASVMGLFGMGEFAGRLATALLDTCVCLVTYAAARLLYGRLSGWFAAGALATSLLGYGLSRAAMLDVPVSLFLTACFACFLAAQKNSSGRFYLLMYVAAALAVMTKGLIGIVIPGMVIGSWVLATKNWRILKDARLFTGLIIVLAIAAPWHVLMAMKHPAFLDFYFIHEHFTRYLTDEHKRVEPWWFFIAILPAGLLPWTFVIPHSWRDLLWPIREMPQRVRHDNVFLLLWIVFPLIFFSASHSKLAPYIFPVFPPVCILLGHYLAESWEHRVPVKPLRNNALYIVLLFSAAIVLYFAVLLPDDNDKKLAFSAITFPMLLPIIAALVVLAYAIIAKRSSRFLIVALAAFGITAEITANYAAASLDRASIKPLIPILSARLHDGDMVVAYGSYFQDLPIYLNRNVIVAGYYGELEFGVTHYPETQDWMISTQQFWQDCVRAKQGIYVFMKKTTLAGLTMPASCPLQVIAEYGKTVLLEKQHP